MSVTSFPLDFAWSDLTGPLMKRRWVQDGRENLNRLRVMANAFFRELEFIIGQCSVKTVISSFEVSFDVMV